MKTIINASATHFSINGVNIAKTFNVFVNGTTIFLKSASGTEAIQIESEQCSVDGVNYAGFGSNTETMAAALALIVFNKGGGSGTGAVTIIKGSVAAAANLDPVYGGLDGDMFITLNDGHGHVWNGVNWTDVGQIKGDKGDTGLKGDKGDKGDAGDQAVVSPFWSWIFDFTESTSLTMTFQLSEAIKITDLDLLQGVPTVEIKVNNVIYVFGALIPAKALINVTPSEQSRFGYTIESIP